MALPSGGQSTISMREPVGIADTLFDLDDSRKKTPQVHTSALGNPLVTVVHQFGVFNMGLLFCICPMLLPEMNSFFMQASLLPV